MDSFSARKSALIAHLVEHSVRTDGPFTLRSGEVSAWYIDARQTTFSGEGAWLVGRAMLAEIPGGIDAIGGMTMGADPIAVALAMVAADEGVDLASFSIRKTAKGHGTGGRLVGPIGAGSRVVALEDTTTTGAALGEAIEVLREADVVVVRVVALVDRSNGATARRIAELGVPYVGLVTPRDLGVEL
ncbi:MAG: orotate phosphoribosyltransferase [Actinomycetia bacterium]|nr:orotate phosphoribosyltransferase [Actinomycetes bacterium]